MNCHLCNKEEAGDDYKYHCNECGKEVEREYAEFKHDESKEPTEEDLQ